MIDWDKVNNANVINDPFPHIETGVVLDQDTCQNIFETCLPFAFDHNQNPDESAWRVTPFENDMNLDSLAHDIMNELNSFNWVGYMSEKFGISISSVFFSYATSNKDHEFGWHTDEPEITNVVGKILLYISTDVGTQLHTDNQTEPYKVTAGEPGNMFIFPTSNKSWHSTNFTTLSNDNVRITISGTFKK